MTIAMMEKNTKSFLYNLKKIGSSSGDNHVAPTKPTQKKWTKSRLATILRHKDICCNWDEIGKPQPGGLLVD